MRQIQADHVFFSECVAFTVRLYLPFHISYTIHDYGCTRSNIAFHFNWYGCFPLDSLRLSNFYCLLCSKCMHLEELYFLYMDKTNALYWFIGGAHLPICEWEYSESHVNAMQIGFTLLFYAQSNEQCHSFIFEMKIYKRGKEIITIFINIKIAW